MPAAPSDLHIQGEIKFIEERDALFLELGSQFEQMARSDAARRSDFDSIEKSLEMERSDRNHFDALRKKGEQQWRLNQKEDADFVVDCKRDIARNMKEWATEKNGKVITSEKERTEAEEDACDAAIQAHKAVCNKRREALHHKWKKDMKLEQKAITKAAENKINREKRRDKEMRRRKVLEDEWKKIQKKRKETEIQACKEYIWMEEFRQKQIESQNQHSKQLKTMAEFHKHRDKWMKWEKMNDVGYINQLKQAQKEAKKQEKRKQELELQKKRLQMDSTHFLHNLHIFQRYKKGKDMIVEYRPPSPNRHNQSNPRYAETHQCKAFHKGKQPEEEEDMESSLEEGHHCLQIGYPGWRNTPTPARTSPSFEHFPHPQIADAQGSPRTCTSDGEEQEALHNTSGSSSDGPNNSAKLVNTEEEKNLKIKLLAQLHATGKHSPTSLITEIHNPTKVATEDVPSCFVDLVNVNHQDEKIDVTVRQQAQDQAQEWFKQHNQHWGGPVGCWESDEDEEEEEDASVEVESTVDDKQSRMTAWLDERCLV